MLRHADRERLRRTAHVERALAGRRAVSAIEPSDAALALSHRPVRRRSLDGENEPHPLLPRPLSDDDDDDDDDAV